MADPIPPAAPAAPAQQLETLTFDPGADFTAMEGGTYDPQDRAPVPVPTLPQPAASPAPAAPAAPAPAAPPAAPAPVQPAATPAAPGAAPAAPASPAAPGDSLGIEPPVPFQPPATKAPRARELREAYDKAKSQIGTLEQQIAELQQKLNMPQQPGADLTPTIKKLEEERDKLNQQLSTVAYERSPVYQQTYIQPYKNALKEGFATVQEFTITDPSTGLERKGRPEDFEAIRQLPLAQAAAESNRLFGAVGGPIVFQQAMQAKRLASAAEQALNSAYENLTKQQQEQAANAAMAAEELRKVSETIQLDPRFAEYFAEDAQNPTKAKLLAAGKTLIKAVTERPESLTRGQYLHAVAMMRHKAASFDWVAHQLNEARAQVAKLQSELDSIYDSEPGSDKNGGGSAPGGTSQGGGSYQLPDVNSEIDELAR